MTTYEVEFGLNECQSGSEWTRVHAQPSPL